MAPVVAAEQRPAAGLMVGPAAGLMVGAARLSAAVAGCHMFRGARSLLWVAAVCYSSCCPRGVEGYGLLQSAAVQHWSALRSSPGGSSAGAAAAPAAPRSPSEAATTHAHSVSSASSTGRQGRRCEGTLLLKQRERTREGAAMRAATSSCCSRGDSPKLFISESTSCSDIAAAAMWGSACCSGVSGRGRFAEPGGPPSPSCCASMPGLASCTPRRSWGAWPLARGSCSPASIAERNSSLGGQQFRSPAVVGL